MTLEVRRSQQQESVSQEPYDRWISPQGEIKAEFYRSGDHFLVRFLGDADFQISEDGQRVVAMPTLTANDETVGDLFRNAICPVLANHTGGLCLHGSAVLLGDRGIAFVGRSRSGKTTLAGAFAKAGFPFLTEDVVDLVGNDGRYDIQSKEPVLRLMPDSAAHLLGSADRNEQGKRTIEPAAQIPHSKNSASLAAIVILGEDRPRDVQLDRLTADAALVSLLQHSFILDVEDKPRLSAHFSRLADLAQTVPCYSLDYRRDYSELERVIATVGDHFLEQGASDEAE